MPSQASMGDGTNSARPGAAGPSRPRLGGMSFQTRIFLANATVLAAAVLALALSPVTVSDPVARGDVEVAEPTVALNEIIPMVERGHVKGSSPARVSSRQSPSAHW